MKLHDNLTFNLYKKLLPAQMLSLLASAICTFITTAMIGNFLDKKALAASNLVAGFTNVWSVLGVLITAGTIFFINQSICEKDKKSEEKYLSSSLFFSGLLGIAVASVCAAFPFLISSLLNSTKEILPSSNDLIRGFSVGYLCMLPSAVLNVIFQIHSDSRKTVVSSLILTITNVLLNLVFLKILNKGILFAGISFSIAQVASLTYLIISYLKKKYIGIKIGSFSPTALARLLIIGFSHSVGVILPSIKMVFLNSVSAEVGGIKALSALASIKGVDAVTHAIFYPAFSVVTLMVTSIFINERDREGLKKSVSTVFKMAIIGSVFLSLVMFVVARWSAVLFKTEDVLYTVRAQQIFSFGFPWFMLSTVFVKIFSNLERIKEINIVSLFAFLLFPVSIIWLFPRLFGDTGLWLSIPTSDFVGLLVILIYIVIVNKKIPRSMDELLHLDEDFGAAHKDSYSIGISTQEEVQKAYSEIIDFCVSKGIEKRKAMHSGLCFEEIATNIISHGFLGEDNLINLSVIYQNCGIRLIIRDNCRPFDMNKRFSQLDDNDLVKGCGIRIVMRLAEKVEYTSIYGLNILSIYMK